jgi:hypothetical protein
MNLDKIVPKMQELIATKRFEHFLQELLANDQETLRSVIALDSCQQLLKVQQLLLHNSGLLDRFARHYTSFQEV